MMTQAIESIEGVRVYKTKTPTTCKVHKWVGWIAMQSLGRTLADAPQTGTLEISADQYNAMFVGVVPAKRYKHYMTLSKLIVAARQDNIDVLVLSW